MAAAIDSKPWGSSIENQLERLFKTLSPPDAFIIDNSLEGRSQELSEWVAVHAIQINYKVGVETKNCTRNPKEKGLKLSEKQNTTQPNAR